MDLIQVWQGTKNSLGSMEEVCYNNNVIDVRDTNHLVDITLHNK